jgi:hypothetical protein
MPPKHLLLAAIVDAINIYQHDPRFQRHIKDRAKFEQQGEANGDVWSAKYDAAELVTNRFFETIAQSIKAGNK